MRPLLSDTQIGEMTVDLRLGYDFLVSNLTRKPFIGLDKHDRNHRSIKSFFQATRRDIGDRFILYPRQVVLATTLEYVGLPDDVYVDIISRSSYSRLGINHNTLMQPGYRGCFPLELVNHGNTPIELVVGSRLVQMRLNETRKPTNYSAAPVRRKYIGNVRPTVSRADLDIEIATLLKHKR